MEEIPLNCLASPSHADKWLLEIKNQNKTFNLCYACAFSYLENPHNLNLRKKFVLSTLLNVLQTSPEIIVEIVSEDEMVSFHSIEVMLSLIRNNDVKTVTLAGECLLLFLSHMKKEKFGLAVAERLTVEVEECEDYEQRFSHFLFLGRLFGLFPEFIPIILNEHDQLLPMLANGMTYPSEDVKSAVIFLALQIFSTEFSYKSQILSISDSLFSRGILSALKTTQSKALMINSLALLKTFTTQNPKRYISLFENSVDGMNLTIIIKKFILSTETSFQIYIIQFLCHLLLNSPLLENHMTQLVNANITDLLFEVISTKNEILIESILCCLELFSHHSIFFEKNYALFGVPVLIDIAYYLSKLKNWRLFHKNLNLLTSMITSDKCLMSTDFLATHFQQSIQLIVKCVNVQNPSVLFTVCQFFQIFLKKENLPSPLPLMQILDTVSLCFRSLSKFLLSQSHASLSLKNASSSSVPIELKVLASGLNLVSSCLRIAKYCSSSTDTLEEQFIYPTNTDGMTSQSPSDKKEALEKTIKFSFLALEKIFIPFCLKVDSCSTVGQYCWFHLVQALQAVFEEVPHHPLVMQLANKLLKARFIRHIWKLKVLDISSQCDIVEVQGSCNKCLCALLKSFVLEQDCPAVYLRHLESGIKLLNSPLEECASILSQKCSIIEDANFELDACGASSAQAAFLFVCYMSYLHGNLVVEVKSMMPHLIYFITCNSDKLSSSSIMLKHLVLLWAVCMQECLKKSNTKLHPGFEEANSIIWDVLLKLPVPLDVYTHHKVFLWWCVATNEQNSLNSSVLYLWIKCGLEDVSHPSNESMKTVIELLQSNRLAKQIFVSLFDFDSEMKAKNVFSLLQQVFECNLPKHENEVLLKSFQDMFAVLIQHIQVGLVKVCIMRKEKNSDDEMLCTGLDCLLWCYERINQSDVVLDIKLLMHIIGLCSSTTLNTKELVSSLRYLKHSVKIENDQRAWHILTGNSKLSKFLYYTFKSEIEVETLCLLESILRCQVTKNLKSSQHINISFSRFLKWLYFPKSRHPAYSLLSSLIKVEFKDAFVLITSKGNVLWIPNKPFPRLETRLLIMYLQNSMLLAESTSYNDELIDNYLKFLSFISKNDVQLEDHVMLQPWIKIVLESKLNLTEACTLFEKWFSYRKINESIIGVIQQFANTVVKVQTEKKTSKESLNKLCKGVYENYIPKEVKETVDALHTESNDVEATEPSILSQAEQLVSSYVQNNLL